MMEGFQDSTLSVVYYQLNASRGTTIVIAADSVTFLLILRGYFDISIYAGLFVFIACLPYFYTIILLKPNISATSTILRLFLIAFIINRPGQSVEVSKTPSNE